MSKDARFWRNVTLIALAHVVFIAGLIRWSVEARNSSNAQSIVWLGDVSGVSTVTKPTTVEPPRPAKLPPSPEPSLPKTDEAEKADTNAEKKKIAKTAPGKDESSSGSRRTGTGKISSGGKGGHSGGGNSASEFGWYGNMLHDRFYSAWIQPTTTVAFGTKISTLVRVRIEKDGRVSKFEIIKLSENIVVNESVAGIAKQVTQVDPPPVELSKGGHYEVKINFELNTDRAPAK